MKNIYAILDIGSATLKFLVAEISNLNANVLFVKTIPSHGVKKGIIEDDRILTRDIQKVIKEAEEFLKTKITSVALTIPNYIKVIVVLVLKMMVLKLLMRIF